MGHQVDTAWDNGHVTPITLPTFYDEPLDVNGERAALQTIVARLLEFLFRKPWGKVPERRLIILGIALGVPQLRGRTLAQFAKEQGISKNSTSEHMLQIRKFFGIEANNFSTVAFRESCRKGARKRWKSKA